MNLEKNKICTTIASAPLVGLNYMPGSSASETSGDKEGQLHHPGPLRPACNVRPFPALQEKQLLSRVEAAAFLGVSPQTLAAWACNRRVNLPYVKLGRRVVYRRRDLDEFCATSRVVPSEFRVAA